MRSGEAGERSPAELEPPPPPDSAPEPLPSNAKSLLAAAAPSLGATQHFAKSSSSVCMCAVAAAPNRGAALYAPESSGEPPNAAKAREARSPSSMRRCSGRAAWKPASQSMAAVIRAMVALTRCTAARAASAAAAAPAEAEADSFSCELCWSARAQSSSRLRSAAATAAANDWATGAAAVQPAASTRDASSYRNSGGGGVLCIMSPEDLSSAATNEDDIRAIAENWEDAARCPMPVEPSKVAYTSATWSSVARCEGHKCRRRSPSEKDDLCSNADTAASREGRASVEPAAAAAAACTAAVAIHCIFQCCALQAQVPPTDILRTKAGDSHQYKLM